MLTTILTPTSGTATICGFDIVKDAMKVRRSVGVVPQEYTADEDLSGIENVLLCADLYGIPRSVSKPRANELLRLVELDAAAKRKVDTYSGGMRRRLELACGLISRPRLLFLDEPTLGLDVQTRTAVWDYIKKLKTEYNMTLFMTTHYLEEADAMCDRIAIIDHGKILKMGTPKELKDSLGGDVIEIAVKEDSEDLSSILSKVSLVKEVKKEDHTYRIMAELGEEAAPEIIEAVRDKGLHISRISVTKPTLDEVYLAITGRRIRDEQANWEDTMSTRRTMSEGEELEVTDMSNTSAKGSADTKLSTSPLHGIWAMTNRELKKWYKAPFVLGMSLVQPFIWMGLFGKAMNISAIFTGSSFNIPGLNIPAVGAEHPGQDHDAEHLRHVGLLLLPGRRDARLHNALHGHVHWHVHSVGQEVRDPEQVPEHAHLAQRDTREQGAELRDQGDHPGGDRADDRRALGDERLQTLRAGDSGDLRGPDPDADRLRLPVRDAGPQGNELGDPDGADEPAEPAAALREQRHVPGLVHAQLAAAGGQDQPGELRGRHQRQLLLGSAPTLYSVPLEFLYLGGFAILMAIIGQVMARRLLSR